MQKLATKKKTRVQADGESDRAARCPTLPADDAVAARRRPTRVYFRAHGHRAASPAARRSTSRQGTEAIIGSAGAHRPARRALLPSARRRRSRFRDGRLWLHDFEAGNGVFLRIKAPVELGLGDEFVVGDQLLRIERNPTPQTGPIPGPTYFYSSPQVALVVPRRADLRGRRAGRVRPRSRHDAADRRRRRATSSSRATRW